MAILHVRNVPEGLYERLKERAEAGRRSLRAEVVTLPVRSDVSCPPPLPHHHWRTLYDPMA